MFLSGIILIPSLLISLGYCFIGKYVYTLGARNIKYWVDIKNKRAQELTAKGNKIIFLSGSNTLHGLDSKRASEETGLPVLNYGLHGAFASYIFELGKQIAHKGDIIVMPLEFEYYSNENNPNHQSPYLEYLISYLPEEFQKANLYEKFVISTFLVQNWLLKPTFNLKKNEITTEFEGQLNEYGDYIDHEGTEEKFLKSLNTVKRITADIPKDLKNYPLYNFIQYCKENDIKLYAMLPNYYRPKDFTKEEMKAYSDIIDFYREQDVPFIGLPESSYFTEKTMFKDTIYHTNEVGTKIRTDWIIKNVLSQPEIRKINN